MKSQTSMLPVLLEDSVAAVHAYRAIFGHSYWNQRDREAFARLQATIDRIIEAGPERQSLAQRLASRPWLRQRR